MDGQLIDDALPTILTAPLRLTAPPGLTLRQIIDLAELTPDVEDRLILFLNGTAVRDWAHVLTCESDIVEVAVLPAGGDRGTTKQVAASLAVIAISIAAGPAAGFILGAAAKGTMAYYALTAGITLVGTMAVSALIQPGAPYASGTRSRRQASENPAYQINGQSNEARPYGTVPRLYGTTRFYPLLAATPFFSTVGKTSSMTALYDYGIGHVELTNIRVGNQDISNLAPHTLTHTNSLCDDLSFVAKAPFYEDIAHDLAMNVPFTATTHAGSVNATLDLFFPQGLAAIAASGARSQASVGVTTEFRKSGTADPWIPVAAPNYLGVATAPQAWTWVPTYIADDTYWAVTDGVASDGSATSELRLVQGGKVLLAQTQRKQGGYYDGTTEWNLGGVIYRRGASRQVTPGYGGKPSTTRTSYELALPTVAPANAVQIMAATLVPFTASIRMVFPEPGTYDVRITRLTPVTDNTDVVAITRVDLATVSMLTSFHGGKVVNLSRRHTMQEIAFTASDTVNATVDGVNAIATSWVRSVTSTGWGPLVATSNPAYIALDIATGPACLAPLADDQIDFASWAALASRCAELVTTTVNGVTYQTPRHEWNGAIDTDMTAQDAIDAVLSVARAARVTTPAGKFGVMLDVPKDQPRQLITPVNSWGFEGSRTFTPVPDGLRVSFVDASADYLPRDVIAYRDGKDETNAVLIEDLQTWGITSMPQAWRHGRYMLAQGILRSETFSVYMDAENLAVGVGDLVLVQTDVPKLGGLAARVIAVDAGDDSLIEVNRPMELGAGFYTLRLGDGTILQGVVVDQTSPTTFQISADTGVAPDDVIVFGDTDTAAHPYLVQAVEPGNDLSARLTLVAYNPGVYSADQGVIPPWDPGFGNDVDQTADVRVAITSLASAWVYADGIPYAEVTITWTPTSAAYAYTGADVALRTGQVTEVIGEVAKAGAGALTWRIPYDASSLFDTPLTFIVRPHSVSGALGMSAEQAITIAAYDVTPAAPTQFALDTRGSALTLSWLPSASQDVAAYVLRYTPDTVNPTWSTSQFLARVEGKLTSATVPARVGTYFLRAVNVIGRLSDIVMMRMPMSALPDLKLYDLLDDSPGWAGTLDGFQKGYTPPGGAGARVKLLSGPIIIATMAGVTVYTVRTIGGAYVNVGSADAIPAGYLVSNIDWTLDTTERATYTSDVVLDLGAIYELHVQATMLAGVINADGAPELGATQGYGVTPYVDTPVTYTDGSGYDAGWSVWLEYQTKAEAGGAWSPWRRVVSGIVTGRFFQFRIAAAASHGSARIVVYDGKITLSMAGRAWVSDQLAVPASGLTVNFDPDFYAPPGLSVTAEEGGVSASYDIDNLTRSSFTIFVLRKSNQTPTAGTAYVVATGYGTERTSAI